MVGGVVAFRVYPLDRVDVGIADWRHGLEFTCAGIGLSPFIMVGGVLCCLIVLLASGWAVGWHAARDDHRVFPECLYLAYVK